MAKRRHQTGGPRLRSPGAQRLVDRLGKVFPTEDEIRDALVAWATEKKIKQRRVTAFLSGEYWNFSDPNLLAEFVSAVTKADAKPEEFTNPKGVPYFPMDFAMRVAPCAEISALRGKYRCFRPGTDLMSENRKLVYKDDADIHELTITDYGPFMPGQFKYLTMSSDKNTNKGAWHGYAVSSHSRLFLLGFCVEGDDAAYFVLRRHPHPEHKDAVLVGMQSLVLPFKDRGDPMHAISRPIAAVRSGIANTVKFKSAIDWINDNRFQPHGFAISLADQSNKT